MDRAWKILTWLLAVFTAAGILFLGIVDLTPYLASHDIASTEGATASPPSIAAPEHKEPPTEPAPPSPMKTGAVASEKPPDVTAETWTSPPIIEEQNRPEPLPARQTPPDEPSTAQERLGADALNLEAGPARYPYSVLLASFKTLEMAEKALDIYRGRGIQAYAVRVDLQEQGIWYRVFTGHFPSQETAEAFLKEEGLKDALVRQTRFAVLADILPEGETTGGMEERLLSLGLHPYAVEGPEGMRRLYVGAFYTKEGAEELCMDLQSRGFPCRAVER